MRTAGSRRTGRRQITAGGIAIAALLTAALTGSAPTPAAAAGSAAASPAVFNRTTLAYSSKLSLTEEAQRYGVMVLQPTDGPDVKILHAANPKLVVLMYTDPLYSSTTDPSGLLNCTGYQNDTAHDRSWFLHSQSGKALSTGGKEFLMDMSNPAYQRSCITHAAALAKYYGFNGVMLDNLHSSPASVLPAHTTVAKYRSNSAWTAAMQSFLNYAAKTLHAQHLKVAANLIGVSSSTWKHWSAPLDGSELQTWTAGSQGAAQQVPYWTTNLADVAWSEAHHKYAILDSYSQTDAGNTYGLASMLLVAHGYASYATDNTKIYGSHEAWFPQYITAIELGAAKGSYTKLSNHAYKRTFTNGIVLVNPTTHTVKRFSLHGKYRNNNTTISAITLAPTSGVVLLNASYHPPANPSTTSSSTGGTTSNGTSGSGTTGNGSTTAGSTAGSTSGASASGSSTSGSTAGLGASPALFNRQAFVYTSQLTYAQEAARYQFIILTSLDASKVAALHAANPNLKILMYSMALYSSTADPNGNETCTPYASDNANDPSWFLLDKNGNRLPAKTNDYMMDMGNSGYQQACAADAIALAKADGFNGILFDGLNSSWSPFISNGAVPAKYTSTGQWQAAMQSFLNYVGKTVEGAGLMAFANIGGVSNTVWDQWTTPLTGSMEQGFTDGGSGLAEQVPYFTEKLDYDAWNEAHGKYALEDSYNMTEAGNTYGLAAMLLVANGYSSWSTSNTDDTSSYEQWYPEYGDAQQLGSATGPYTVLPNGVYERRFQNGIVVVNATTSPVSTFSLGGTYYGTTTASTSSVSLPPTSGLILLQG